MTENSLKLTAGNFTIDAAAPDGQPSRSITGLAVPWNVTTTDSLGTKVKFLPGSLPEDGRPPRLLEAHDPSKVRGIVTERVSTDEGMMFTAKLAETRDADDTMALLLMGAYDSVSVGVTPTKFKHDKDGTMVVESARFNELSIVAEPAFEQARIEKVAASAPEDDTPDEEPTTPEPEEDSMTESTHVEAAAPTIIPTQPIQFAQPAKPFEFPSVTEYVTKALAGGSEFAEFNAKIRAAAPDVVTTDTPGILPEPIVGPVYNNFRGLRPVCDAIGVRAMPQSGKIFRRPEVTTHTTMGLSNGENAALDAGTFVVSNNNIEKKLYGGYVRLSEEDQDMTDPNVVALILDDMARIYANETDNVAADNLASGITNTNAFNFANVLNPATWAAWIATAARDILTDSNGNLPTHLFVNPEAWGWLIQLCDDQKRPLFPELGPVNAFGSLSAGQRGGVAFGMQVVVDRNFPADFWALGDPTGFEIYEQQKGAISVEAADGSLSRYIKWRGYFATLMIDPTKFIKAVNA